VERLVIHIITLGKGSTAAAQRIKQFGKVEELVLVTIRHALSPLIHLHPNYKTTAAQWLWEFFSPFVSV